MFVYSQIRETVVNGMNISTMLLSGTGVANGIVDLMLVRISSKYKMNTVRTNYKLHYSLGLSFLFLILSQCIVPLIPQIIFHNIHTLLFLRSKFRLGRWVFRDYSHCSWSIVPIFNYPGNLSDETAGLEQTRQFFHRQFNSSFTAHEVHIPWYST